MTTDIHIPEEAVEAAARAMCARAYEHLPEMRAEDTFTPDADYWLAQATAALQAGLRAWPGVNEAEVETPDGSRWLQSVILPLPQETDND